MQDVPKPHRQRDRQRDVALTNIVGRITLDLHFTGRSYTDGDRTTQTLAKKYPPEASGLQEYGAIPAKAKRLTRRFGSSMSGRS